ncbi:MAG: amino acid ABC transporter substrate-binding protein [Pseudomonadota bacterium]
MRTFWTGAVLSAGLMLAPAAAFADAGDSPVLQRIDERGVVNVGHRETSIPFAFLDESGTPIGYTIDVCMKIVEKIGEELGRDDLEVNLVPVTGQTRIALMANGTIDLECGSTTNNLTRQRQVAYLPTTFITGTKIAVGAGSDATSIDEMEGMILGVSSGTTNEKAIKAYIEDKGLDIRIQEFKDHAQAWLAMETERIDGYGSDDVLLFGLISKAKAPDDWKVVGEYMSFDPYAIMVPRNDSTFQRLGTSVLAELMRTGEMEEMYNKWFDPGPTNIAMPMTDTLKTAFQIQALPE